MASSAGASSDSMNVKVAVRSRPLSTKEVAEMTDPCLSFPDGRSVVISGSRDGQSVQRNQYTFDYAYDSDSNQGQVFEDLGKPVLNQALEGYNATIFAYGQTGSGKTHTMMGSKEDPGIIPRLCDELFKSVQELSKNEEKFKREFLVTCSYLEIYNEKIQDLLNPTDRKLEVKGTKKTGIYVTNLAEIVVKNAEQVQALILDGNRLRHVAETKMNNKSSRSHAVFTINVSQKSTEPDVLDPNVTTETSLKSKINLVDLAGSERLDRTEATGTTKQQGIAINQSLTTLGTVISSLVKGDAHIPYRNSVLTRLLEQSLGGNCMTIMVATLSPALNSYSETRSTLKYADRAKQIKNEHKKNEDVTQRKLRELQDTIKELQAQLEAAKDAKENQRRIEEYEALKRELQEAREQTWESKEAMSEKFQQERAENPSILELLRNFDKSETLRAEMEEVEKRYRDIDGQIRRCKRKIRVLKSEYEKQDKLDKAGELDQDGKKLLRDIRTKLKKEVGTHKELADTFMEIKKDKIRLQMAQLTAGQVGFQEALREDLRAEIERENEQRMLEERQRIRDELRKEYEGSSSGDLGENVEELKEKLTRAYRDIQVLEESFDMLAEEHSEELAERLQEAAIMTELKLEMQQVHQLKVFKKYRDFFDEGKRKLEQRYSELLQDAVQDTLMYKNRVQELEQQVEDLKEQLLL